MKNARDLLTNDEIDRLVECELSQSQRRVLITRIESEPGGWRRCALAFMEAQSWRKSFRSFLGATTADSAPTDIENKRSTTMRPRKVLVLSTLVAAIVISFVVGISVGQSWTVKDDFIANLKSDLPAPGGEVSPPQTPATQSVADEGESRIIGFVNLGYNEIEAVPIVSGPGLDDQWLANQPAPLSEYEMRRLESLGWYVQQKRQLMKIQLTNGRVLTVPIESVRYKFVSPPVL